MTTTTIDDEGVPRMTDDWEQLLQDEDFAYYRGDLVLSSPESFTVEEKWAILLEMFESSIAVQKAIQEDFLSHSPEERRMLLDVCIGSGTQSEEWWKDTLLGYAEMPDYPDEIAGETDSPGIA